MNEEKKTNINTVDYWNARFGSGHWASHGGHSQTRFFAEYQQPFFYIPSDFTGAICDFGCGAGDAFPVYQKAWPKAKLFGIDFSDEAIKLCRKRYGHIAEFMSGNERQIPKVDIIICSNVLEHIDDNTGIIERMLKQCKVLYVIVPYKEHPLTSEHIRKYDDDSFSVFPVVRKVIFKSRGWTEFGLRGLGRLYLEKIFRYCTGQPVCRRKMQILFEIPSDPGRGLSENKSQPITHK